MTSDDWREVKSSQNIKIYSILKRSCAFTPKSSDPNFSVNMAFSSSFTAIHTAHIFLERKDSDIALPDGTKVMTNPNNFTSPDWGRSLSTTGNCNTYDDRSNGYCS